MMTGSEKLGLSIECALARAVDASGHNHDLGALLSKSPMSAWPAPSFFTVGLVQLPNWSVDTAASRFRPQDARHRSTNKQGARDATRR